MRADLKKGLELIYKHFACFGLEMHIGRGDSPSKTECVFFPPPGFFDSHLPALQQSNTNSDNTLENDHEGIIANEDMHNKESARTRREKEGLLYDELVETRPITVADGLVTFCRHFKYLGSFISFSLSDDFDIEN